MRRHAARHGHLRLHGGYATCVLVSVIGLIVLHGAVRSALFVLVGLVPLVTVSWSLRVGRFDDRRPWRLVLVGLTVLTGCSCLELLGALGVGVPGAAVVQPLLDATGILALLAANVVVVIRHAPRDGGGVIDAALTGVGVAGPLWEFLLRPKLSALQAPGPAQAAALVNVLLLLAMLGALMRIAGTAERARIALRYLFVSFWSTIGGVILLIMLFGSGGNAESWPEVLFAVGYLSLAAAAAHPSAAHLTEPQGWRREGLSSIRLAYLGGVLAMNPIVGVVPLLWGEPADAPLLSIGTLGVIGLVVTRIGQLLRQRHEAQAALAYQASHDELTGLPNRRTVLAALDEELGRRSAGTTGTLAVLYCDLDGFKPVNDQLGHRAGDDVLREVADRLRVSVRSGDVVGRIGGDEFMVVCSNLDEPGAIALRERIQEAISATLRTGDGAEVQVGVTIGISLVASGDQVDTDGLVAEADHAMYERKRRRPVPV